MNDLIIGILLMLLALAMAFPTLLYGVRFSVLWNRRKQTALTAEEEKRLRRNGVLFLVCLLAVYGLAFGGIRFF